MLTGRQFGLRVEHHAGAERFAVGADHPEAGLAGQQPAESVASLCLHVGGVVPAAEFVFELADPLGALGDLLLGLAQIVLLVEIDAQRVGV